MVAAGMNGYRFFLACAATMGCAAAGTLFGQATDTPNMVPHPPVVVTLPTPVQPASVKQVPPPGQIPDSIIAFDSVNKEITVPAGTMEGRFEFSLTNLSPKAVTINSVATSCGCTVAKLPTQPWTLVPGTSGQIHVTMNLAGKSGRITKVVTVNSDQGVKTLLVNTMITPGTAQSGMGDREKNLAAAKVDRQAVFKGDCARCHAETTHGKIGKDLYAAACGVCHESDHRASMVSNLHAIPQQTNADFWRNWITNGKAGTLMPAFAQAQGGPLTDAQISSLVQYLTVAIPSHSVAPVRTGQ
jgi:cytochrome c553